MKLALFLDRLEKKSLQAGLLLRAMKEKCELFQHHNPCPEGKFSDKAVGFRCRLVPVWVRFKYRHHSIWNNSLRKDKQKNEILNTDSIIRWSIDGLPITYVKYVSPVWEGC